jgi:SAM-dependent methyltransferase
VEREDWNRRWRERGFHCEDDPDELLAAELAGLVPGRALDLGCGAGRAAIWLARRGWRVTGVDFSDAALDIARATGADVEWVLADLHEYEPEPGAFDLVLLLYVHLPAGERRTILAGAAAALAPAGMLLVVGHDLTNLGTGAPGPSDPDVLYTPDAVAGELSGLGVEKAGRVARRVQTDDGEVEAIDTLVIASNG